MRVLILHSRYLSGPASGENRVVEDEARLLREAGHHVRVWSPAPDADGVGSHLRLGASAVWSKRSGDLVNRAVRQDQVEVVHAHNLYPTLSPSVLRSASRAGAAVVVTLHNYRMMCLPANFLLDGEVCERCLGRAPLPGVTFRCYRGSLPGSAALAASLILHRRLGTFDHVSRFLAVSDFVREKHLEAGMDPDRVLTKPNFSWPTERRVGPGEHFLFLGRLAPEKGLDTVLAAWKGDPPGRLVVAGDGPEAASLRRSAPSGVEFRGAVPGDQVPSLIRGARAVLLPSRWYEAAPRTITEAYAAGVPVIASRIGALTEAVQDGMTGKLVPLGDAAAWRGAAASLLEDAESERLGEKAWDTWSRLYSAERALENLEAAYAEALSAKAS